MDALYELAEFVANTSYKDLPAEVVDRARLVLRDTIAVIIGGMRESEVAALADHAAQQTPGPASLWGHSGSTSPEWAVLVHGTAGTTLEMDEGHAFARGHAAIHAVPPALALAQARGTTPQDALTALVVGYEVAARAGVATRLRQPVHPFGAWGVLGAAAIGAWFNRLDAQQVAETLEVAASYAITPSFETAYQGANVRNTYAGVVNRLGLLAADLYLLGFRGEVGGLNTAFGEILGHSFNSEALTDGLGERYEIMRGYFKPHSACRYTHAAVDAALLLREDGDVVPGAIDRIEVATYDIAAHLSEPAPKTPLAGRFSLPFVVAATLARGHAGPEIFAPEALNDPTILGLSAKVAAYENPEYTALTPARRPAQVTLHFTDGSTRSRQVMGSKGDPDQPMSEQELIAKFHMLADPTIGHDRASEAMARIGQFDQLPDIHGLTTLLTPDAI